ncbi:MAG: hypothetical protein B7X04_00810 [Parcubacteria group bacterium 21-54-25]|nr:MAG: hypothetical protein B7X04_00810 [Parcubacteria group bacterium 21-54-25]HQU07949.1 penicillin-binding protein 2 [Candidatus Paceibacterota bacterium]
MRAAFRSRLRILIALLGVLSAILVIRLIFIQLIDGTAYAQKADQQYAANANALYDRGTIYFTRKDGTHIAAATLETGFLVAINPELLTDAQSTYQTLNAITPIDHTTFFTAAAKTNDPYEEVVHHLSQDQGNAIAAMHLPGVLVIRERWRVYPGGTLAAHTIGFTAYDNNNTLAGQYGLENYYNSTLERSDNIYGNFFTQIFSNLGEVFVNAKAAREGDIVTTIEPEVEARLMTDLAAVANEYHGTNTGGIIMVPSTGAIVALGSVPTFNPNTFQTATSSAVFTNPLVQHVYEYGSIVKPITMASALTAGVVTPQTTYNDTGCIHVDGRRICNWDYKARGVIPIGQIIVQSLNVGASWLAEQLGQDRFRTYFTKVFGQKTGIDLPNENGALLRNLYSAQQVDYDNAAFGQGIAMTPVQMIRALGAVANGGVMVTPHLVSEKILTSGAIEKLDWSKKVRVFSTQAAAETTQMMVDLTDTDYKKESIPTMSVAIKTGTAQLPDPSGSYYMNRFFHSFVGFFPSHNPRFIILLYTKDPRGAEYASKTLEPTLMDLVHFLINYYQVPPDRGTPAAYTS